MGKHQREKKDVGYIVIDGWAYETKTHDKNKLLSEIEISRYVICICGHSHIGLKGFRESCKECKCKSFENCQKELWEASDFKKFGRKEFDKLKLWSDWFYIKQPIKAMAEKGYNARFVAGLVGASLSCGGYPSDRGASLGVRFKWKVKE